MMLDSAESYRSRLREIAARALTAQEPQSDVGRATGRRWQTGGIPRQARLAARREFHHNPGGTPDRQRPPGTIHCPVAPDSCTSGMTAARQNAYRAARPGLHGEPVCIRTTPAPSSADPTGRDRTAGPPGCCCACRSSTRS
jgi:hypothetical protein